MIKSKKIVTIILVLLLIATVLSGCAPDTADVTSEPVQTGIEMITVDEVSYPKLDVPDKSVRFLVHWNPAEPNYAAMIARYKEVYGLEVSTVKTTYSQIPTKLASLQAAGDAPDVAIYYNAGFPSMFSKDMFLPIDDFVDFTDPFWAGAKEVSDMYQWNGNQHYMVAGSSIARYCWYNKTLFERYGLETPYDQYKAGTWTWEGLRQAAAELTQDTDGDGNIDQWGISGDFTSHMFASKNTTYVTIQDGVIKNNIKTPEMDTIMNMAYELTNTDKSYTWDWQGLFRAGKLGVVFEGNWITAGDEVLTQMLKDGEIGFVPAPMFEGDTEKRYYAENSGYLIPKGAKNIMGAQAFITATWAFGKSDKAITNWEETNKANGWSEDMISIYKDLNFSDNVLIGVPTATCGDSLRFMWEPIRLMQDGNQTWAQIKESLYPLFQAEIDKEVAKMPKS